MTVNTRIVARFGRLSIDLARVRAAHHLAEEALVRHDARVDEWYAENLRRDPSDAEFLAYLREEQKDDVAYGYPQVLRSALFATGYGVFEFFLTSLCKELQNHIVGPTIGELRGDGIQRSRLYLSKVARVEFPDTEEWQLLVLYGKLRNALVHAQGDLSGSSNLKAIRQLLAKENTFAIRADESALILEQSFTPRFLEIVDRFAEQLDRRFESYIVVP